MLPIELALLCLTSHTAAFGDRRYERVPTQVRYHSTHPGLRPGIHFAAEHGVDQHDVGDCERDPALHHQRPIDKELGPAAVFQIVRLSAASFEEGSSTGYNAKAAPQSIATM